MAMEKQSPFVSPYRPADPSKGVAFEDKAANALDYIAHYLEKIEQHLGAIAIPAIEANEQKKREAAGPENWIEAMEKTKTEA